MSRRPTSAYDRYRVGPLTNQCRCGTRITANATSCRQCTQQGRGASELQTRSLAGSHSQASPLPSPEVRKRCGRCGETKARSEFATDRSRRDGLMVRCKVCDRERNRRYYAATKEGATRGDRG
jgi:hypothetical protein